MLSHADQTTKALLLLLVIGVWGLLLYPLLGAASARAQERQADLPVPYQITAAGDTLYIVYFVEGGMQMRGMQMKAYRAEAADGGLTILESPSKDLP